jgi:protein-S-isoprenylcysteine O-methyltransferase Ste14
VLYALRQIASILLLPYTVTVIVPFCLLENELTLESEPQLGPIRYVATLVGSVAFLLGLTLFVSTVLHFARIGRGTLAPWDPTRVLVVKGVYRYVRNPMISGVLFLLLSEVLLTCSPRVLAWLGLFLVINVIYIPLVEEPGLARRFGERYLEYRRNVPRWVPRLTSWTPPWQDEVAANRDRTSHSTPS